MLAGRMILWVRMRGERSDGAARFEDGDGAAASVRMGANKPILT